MVGHTVVCPFCQGSGKVLLSGHAVTPTQSAIGSNTHENKSAFKDELAQKLKSVTLSEEQIREGYQLLADVVECQHARFDEFKTIKNSYLAFQRQNATYWRCMLSCVICGHTCNEHDRDGVPGRCGVKDCKCVIIQ